MKEAAVPLSAPHRCTIREDHLISFLVSSVSDLPENANFKEHGFIIFIPKVKNSLHTCKCAISCVFENGFRFAAGPTISLL